MTKLTSTNSVSCLQESVLRLHDKEKIVFCVLILVYQYEPDVIQWVRCAATEGLKRDFSSAILEAVNLPWRSRLRLAIEILQGQCDDEED